MRLPTGIDPASLPDIAHYWSHGIDRITAWCLTPFCCHQSVLTFDELEADGAGETTKLLAVKPRLKRTKCGGQYADLQPDWSQRSVGNQHVRNYPLTGPIADIAEPTRLTHPRHRLGAQHLCLSSSPALPVC
jgi:hypothetical protein